MFYNAVQKVIYDRNFCHFQLDQEILSLLSNLLSFFSHGVHLNTVLEMGSGIHLWFD